MNEGVNRLVESKVFLFLSYINVIQREVKKLTKELNFANLDMVSTIKEIDEINDLNYNWANNIGRMLDQLADD